jgi:hypothetical protein
MWLFGTWGTYHGVDLSTSTTEILVVVEAFPQSEQGLGAGLCTGIEQNADFGVQDAANGGEQPSVRVDLLAVLLLQAEHQGACWRCHRGGE